MHSPLAIPYLAVLEARPVVQLVFLIRFEVGAVLSTRPGAPPWPGLIALLTWWLAVVAVYVWNGFCDYPEDVANGSKRPIASGVLSRKMGAWVAGVTAAASIAGSLTVPGLTVWTALFLLLGAAYSTPPLPTKNTSASAAVTVFGLGWVTYAGGVAATGGHLDTAGVIFATTSSAWMAGVGTLVKDLSDITGDRLGGRHTIAVRHGADRARSVAIVAALVIGLAGLGASALWAPRALLGTAGFAAGAVWLGWRAVTAPSQGTDDRHTQRGLYRVFMGAQYAANLLMLIPL